MNSSSSQAPELNTGIEAAARPESDDDDLGGIGFAELLTWLGHGKHQIAVVALVCAAAGAAYAFLTAPVYTARTTLMPPGTQQQSGSAAALAALGSLGSLAGGAKTPDELYAALLRSDSVVRSLDQRFQLQSRYEVKNFETLRKLLPSKIRISADKKSGLLTVEVDDKDAKFSAELANAHATEVSRLLSRLAVSEAQQRRAFFEQQVKDSKDRLIKAETDFRALQESSGVIVLEKQAEALITGVAQVRAAIAEREIKLRVLRTSATEQNPDVQRLTSEIQGLRAELGRMESREGSNSGTAGVPVGRLPGATVDNIRARRELRLQETLLEAMVRQFEAAKLEEAKEGPLLQQVDVAQPPDHKAKPARGVIIAGAFALGLIAASIWVVGRRALSASAQSDPERVAAWAAVKSAWGFRS